MIVINEKKDAFAKSAWGVFNGSKFLIASSSNLDFQRTFNRLQAPHRKAIERGKLDPAIAQEIAVQAMAKNMLIDWDDIIDTEGKPVKYTEELAIRVLTSRLDIREFVQEFSTDLENYRQDDKQEMGKN